MTKQDQNALKVHCNLMWEIFQHRDTVGIKTLKSYINHIYRIASNMVTENCKSKNNWPDFRNAKTWSVNAAKLWQETNLPDGQKRKMLTDEHRIPLGVFTQMLLDGAITSAEGIRNYIIQHGVYCVVTKIENKQLNKKWKTAKTIKEAEERYGKAGIEIVGFNAERNIWKTTHKLMMNLQKENVSF